jgi:hypothetical protein
MNMKTFLMILAATLITTAPAFAKDGEVHEKIIGVNDVYVPSGFDSSSDSFVVVNGLFPHSCYKLKTVKVDNLTATLHEVTTTADVTEGLCLMVIVPFHKEVQLGRLAVGEHVLRFLNGDGTFMEKHLTIER